MKDLRKKLFSLGNKQRSDDKSLPSDTSRSSTGHPANVADSGAVTDFLQKVAAMPPVNPRGAAGKLVFALDATASREATWDRAMQVQAEMFSEAHSLGGLQIQLAYFRGIASFYASDWLTDAEQLLNQMTGIRCEAGITKIERMLEHIKRETRHEKVHAVVYIGDSMEESHDVLCQRAGELGMLNVPLFMFQEGNDPGARRCFTEMARLSNGAYSPFDHNSVDQLRDLLKAVAVYTSGGYRALADFSERAHPAVQLLSRQLPAPRS